MSEASIVDYRADGTVRVHVNGKPVKLRRPKVGELWEIQEGLTDRIDDWQDMEEAHRDSVREAAAEAGVDMDPDPLVDAGGKVLGGWMVLAAEMDEAKREERTALLSDWVAEVAAAEPDDDVDPPPKEWKRTLRDLNRDHNRAVMGLWFSLGRLVFDRLAPPNALPVEDAELDPALGNQRLYVELLRHWQTVPLPSGRSER